jgi:peptidoglycan/LPS O-acetylase OafA/YrhL
MIGVGSLIAMIDLFVKGWTYAAECEGIALAATLGYYWLGGTDTHLGATPTSRADERQSGISQRGGAVAALVMFVAALVGVAVASTVGHPAWPFATIAAIGAISFLVGLRTSGATILGTESDLRTMIILRSDEWQKIMMQRAAKVSQLSMLVVAILGVIAFANSKFDAEFGLITVVSVASVLLVLFVNRNPGKP